MENTILENAALTKWNWCNSNEPTQDGFCYLLNDASASEFDGTMSLASGSVEESQTPETAALFLAQMPALSPASEFPFSAPPDP